MHYQYIVNPNTGRKVKSNGKLGIRILKKYLKQLGGAAFTSDVQPRRQNSEIHRIRDSVSMGEEFSSSGENKTFSGFEISGGVYDAPGNIAVLGDIHADYGALTSALVAGGLIRQKVSEDEWNVLFEIEIARRNGEHATLSRNSVDSLENDRWEWIGGNTYLLY